MSKLPDGATSIKVTDNGGYVYVTPASSQFPPRVEYSGLDRSTALVPVDRIREFACGLSDDDERQALLTLLLRLAPWEQPAARARPTSDMVIRHNERHQPNEGTTS